jgi:hypothetical protein
MPIVAQLLNVEHIIDPLNLRKQSDRCSINCMKVYGIGSEARIVLSKNNDPSYRDRLNPELKAVDDKEIWRAGKTVRSLRPK